MKEFIEKLIGRLEEESYTIHLDGFIASTEKKIVEFTDVQKIVNQLAEEYGKDINVHNNDWISCSEKLPEEQGWYLAHVEHCLNGLVTIEKVLWKKCKYGSWKFYRKGNDTKVIAWQPLPAPYEPKGE